VTRPVSLISTRLRNDAREYLVGWTLGEIGDLFHAEGFSADTSYEPECSGQRRGYVEQFYVTIDWTSQDECRGVLRVFEALIDSAERAGDDYNTAWRDGFVALLARDGFERDGLGRLRARWEALTSSSITSLSDESAIPTLLARMWKVLGALSQAALGVNELRNDYGSGHGRPHRASGLTPRHARLAAQSADTWVRFVLDTMHQRSGETGVSNDSTPPMQVSA
jgi:hypothetical protein